MLWTDRNGTTYSTMSGPEILALLKETKEQQVQHTIDHDKEQLRSDGLNLFNEMFGA